MEISIDDTKKVNQFITIFRNLKNQVEEVNINFKKEQMYLQGMDQNHISLFELILQKSWFSSYNVKNDLILGLNCSILFLVFNCIEEDQKLNLLVDDNGDKLQISFTCENDEIFDKFYEIPLMDINNELLAIPDVEWPMDLTINIQSFSKIIDQLSIFGIDIKFVCEETQIELFSNGDNGKMSVKLDLDNVEEYSIEEGTVLNIIYPLVYVKWICQFMKLSEIVDIHCSENMPMKVFYKLEGDDNYLQFFLAPKIWED
tara:strand:- start:171 stop:944 length:774 start_codon:yes stop_codon:yes gene_type:complete